MIDSHLVSARQAFVCLATVLFLLLALQLPGHPDQFVVSHWLSWPIEASVIVLALVLLPMHRAFWIRLLIVVSLALLLALRLADVGSRLAFGRAFNPLAELHLVQQGWSLASQTVGLTDALCMIALAILVLIIVGVALFYGLGSINRLNTMTRRRVGIFMIATLVVSACAVWIQPEGPVAKSVRFDVLADLRTRVHSVSKTIKDQSQFTEQLAFDPLAVGPAPTLHALQGMDVVILFVESYGRSYTDSDQFSVQAKTTLDAVDNELLLAGLSVRSGWTDSPIRGGRSWLAQATVASGLRLTSQARFDRLVSSDRKPLYSLFRDAGWTSAVLLPVVDEPWIEGAWYDVDRFFDGPALNYKGKDFGYVSMPDQFTLSAFEHQIRSKTHTPLVASIGLLGSHAPWGPLALPVPWNQVDDGSIFDGSNRVGKAFSWRFPAPVRKQYAKSLDLTLATIGEYLARYAKDGLFVIVGDHQPASVIDGWAPNAHVPIHFVSANTAVLNRLPDMNFTDGMLPDTQSPAIAMEDLREMFGSIFEKTALATRNAH